MFALFFFLGEHIFSYYKAGLAYTSPVLTLSPVLLSQCEVCVCGEHLDFRLVLKFLQISHIL